MTPNQLTFLFGTVPCIAMFLTFAIACLPGHPGKAGRFIVIMIIFEVLMWYAVMGG